MSVSERRRSRSGRETWEVLGLLAALGTVGLLVKTAVTEKSDDPVLRPALQRRRLRKILLVSQRRKLTRTEAEDGVVLARRLGYTRLARKLEKIASRAVRTSGDSDQN